MFKFTLFFSAALAVSSAIAYSVSDTFAQFSCITRGLLFSTLLVAVAVVTIKAYVDKYNNKNKGTTV